MTDLPAEIRAFWLDEVGPKGWYSPTAALDDEICRRFEGPWAEARDGAFTSWQGRAADALAYLILTDQFPRNMFRADARAFATDAMALSAADHAISGDLDLAISPPAQQFFYMPYMHAEDLAAQDRAVALFADRMRGPADNLRHARAHHEIIRRFGRFPYRNAALGRTTTPEEEQFFASGGYAAVLNSIGEG